MTCRSLEPLAKCWCAAISTQKLSSCCCRQWWKYMVDVRFFSAAVNSLTAPTQNILLHPPLSIFTKRPFVYAEGEDTALFCCYCAQCRSLNLKVYQYPPVW